MTVLRRAAHAGPIVMALLVGAFLVSPILAHISLVPYIFDCTSGYYCYLKDPVNILFVGNGTRPNSETHVFHHHPGWVYTWGTNMTFVDHGAAEGTDAQIGSTSFFPADRYHQRFNEGYDVDSVWGYWTQGPIHHDIVVWCGFPTHAASSFDAARDHQLDAFASFDQHDWGWAYVGNYQAVQQCDGRWVAGDGYSVVTVI